MSSLDTHIFTLSNSIKSKIFPPYWETRSLGSKVTTSQQIPTDKGLLANTPLKSNEINYRKRKERLDDSSDGDSTDEPAIVIPTSKIAHRDTASTSNMYPSKKRRHVKDVRTFTVYLQVWSTVTTTKPKRTRRTMETTAATTSVTKGPFEFDTSRSFTDFRVQVAISLRCPEALLPLSEFEWRFDGEPQAAPRKSITNYVGFEALVDAVKAKQARGNVVVWLHVPKPAKYDDDQDTELADVVDHSTDSGEEREVVSSEGPTAKMQSAPRGTVATLENICPMGRLSMFQGRLIWQSKTTGSYFELTPTHIKLPGNGDLRAPSMSTYLNKDNRIGVPLSIGPDQTSQAHVGPPGSSTNSQPFTGYPQPPAGYYPYYPARCIPYAPPPGYPYAYMQPHVPGPVPPPPAPPCMETTARDVSLSGFCSLYGVSQSDEAKLAKLGYQPGDRGVEELEEEHWRDYASFTKLGWMSFLSAHRKFCAATGSRTT